MAFNIGDQVRFSGEYGFVRARSDENGMVRYLVECGPVALPMWVPEDTLVKHQDGRFGGHTFVQRAPHTLSVDNFLRDPDEVRAIALAADYGSDLRFYKGVRSNQRFLWPGLREEFGRLLGTPVTEWLGHNANGVFQQTAHEDPLVWHHDTQSYAAAIYLNPNPPPGAGTSFWRDKTHGCRRAPSHQLETARLGSPEAVKEAESVIYDPYNVQHPDNWDLVESVAGLYNRLVIWDAKLMHSATSYEKFAGGDESRLVQLFFFDIDV